MIGLAGSCSVRSPVPLSGSGRLRSPDTVDVQRLRARVDRDGDGAFDADLPIAPFPFGHAQEIVPHIQAAGVASLHTRLSFETGTVVVIPAGHPVDAFFEVLTSDKAMAAHGLLVVVDAADQAGLPPVGEVLARAGGDRSVDAGSVVTLNGTASLSFVEGRELTHHWSQTDGPQVTLGGTDSSTANFTAPDVDVDTSLGFELQVSAGSATDTDGITVTVRPVEMEPPPAEGDPQAGQRAYGEHSCNACHGAGGEGGIGPDLRGIDFATINGEYAGGANHNGTTLTEPETLDVAAWLATLN